MPENAPLNQNEIKQAQDAVLTIKATLGDAIFSTPEEQKNLTEENINLLSNYNILQEALGDDAIRETSTGVDKALVAGQEVLGRIPSTLAGAGAGFLAGNIPGAVLGATAGYLGQDIADLGASIWNAATNKDVELPSEVVDEFMRRTMGLEHTRGHTEGEQKVKFAAELAMPTAFGANVAAKLPQTGRVTKFFGAAPFEQNIAAQLSGHTGAWVAHKSGNPWLALPAAVLAGSAVVATKSGGRTVWNVMRGETGRGGIDKLKTSEVAKRNIDRIKNIEVKPIFMDEAVSKIQRTLKLPETGYIDYIHKIVKQEFELIKKLSRNKRITLESYENFLRSLRGRQQERYNVAVKKGPEATNAYTEASILGMMYKHLEKSMDKLEDARYMVGSVTSGSTKAAKETKQNIDIIRSFRNSWRDMQVAEEIESIVLAAKKGPSNTQFGQIRAGLKEMLDNPTISIHDRHRAEIQRFVSAGGVTNTNAALMLGRLLGNILPGRGMEAARSSQVFMGLMGTAGGGAAAYSYGFSPIVTGTITAGALAWLTGSAAGHGIRRLMNLLDIKTARDLQKSLLGDGMESLMRKMEARAVTTVAAKSGATGASEKGQDQTKWMANILQHGT